MKKLYLYKAYERFWHWAQALLIIILLITGFEIHGTYSLLGYEKAMMLHDLSALTLFILLIFTVFWDFITGEWKQYIPTTKDFGKQVQFYLHGIFIGAHHPVKKTLNSKFNPIQGFTYLILKLILMPIVLISGIFYFLYQNNFIVIQISTLEPIAIIHTVGAFLILTFLVVHVYLTTTGHTPISNIIAMITGWESFDNEELTLIEIELEKEKQKIINKKK